MVDQHIATHAPPVVRGHGLRRRPPRSSRLSAATWTPELVCIFTYLFVIHSGRLGIGTISIVVGVLLLFLSGARIRVPPFLMAFGAFLAWALLTAPLALDPSRAYDRWGDYAKFWLIAFLITNAVRTPAQWRLVAVGWLGIYALFPFRGLAYNVLTGTATQGRYAWNFAFNNPNDYAAVALIALTLAVVTLRPGSPRWVRVCAWAGVAALPVAILFTGSRAGLLGMVVFGSVLLFFSRRRLGIVLLAACAVVVTLPLLPDSTKARIGGMRFLTSAETIAQADEYGSAAERRVILSVATAVAREHLLFGVGIGNYPVANATYAQTRPEWAPASGLRDSHNSYLTLAAETGLVGLGLFGGVVLAVVISLLRERRAEMGAAAGTFGGIEAYAPVVLLAGIAGYATVCATGSYIYFAFPYLFLTLAAGYRGGRPSPVNAGRHRRPLQRRAVGGNARVVQR